MHLETTHEDSYTDATSQSFSRFISIHKDAFKQAVTRPFDIMDADCSLRQGAGGTEFARVGSRTCF